LVIKREVFGHLKGVGECALASDADESKHAGEAAPADRARVRRMVTENFDFVWRTVRRFGVAATCAEDVTQEVLLLASRKLGSIEPGRERAFLFAVALRAASNDRRTKRRHPDLSAAAALGELSDAAPLADELLDREKARAVLDAVLAELPLELREVFVLFEIEELATAEIAALLELPIGTVASRLRRSREQFEAAVARHRARSARIAGGGAR
jgi:RNA polymerase sigma-70 factor (ECF subfamily)